MLVFVVLLLLSEQLLGGDPPAQGVRVVRFDKNTGVAYSKVEYNVIIESRHLYNFILYLGKLFLSFPDNEN